MPDKEKNFTVTAPENMAEMMELYDIMFIEEEKLQFFNVATNYKKICDYQKRIWPDLDYRRTYVRSAMFMCHNRSQNYDTNISAVAHHLELSNQSTMRRCKNWQRAGLINVTNEHNNLESCIYGTSYGLQKIIEYTKLLNTKFICAFRH